MMSRLIRFRLEEGGEVLVEAGDADDGPALVARGDAFDATETFEQALSRIRPLTDAVLKQIAALATGPQEVGVEMGITLKAEAGVILAKTAGEGSLKLSLKWKHE